MRLSNYILNEGRSKEISRADAIELLHGEYKESTEGAAIYRGLGDHNDYLFIAPARFERTSSNTMNYYTLWFDNHSSWSKFPKRSKSIICSTSRNDAKDYGQLYRVFPKPGSLIGICPARDIWISFSSIGEEIDNWDKNNLSNLNNFIYDLIKNGKKHNITHLSEVDTYQELLKLFNDYTLYIDNVYSDISANGDDEGEELSDSEIRERMVDYVEDILFGDYYRSSVFNQLKKTFLDKCVLKGKHVDEFFEGLWKPTDFKVVTAGNHRLPPGKEVWTDGPCVLVLDSVWEET